MLHSNVSRCAKTGTTDPTYEFGGAPPTLTHPEFLFDPMPAFEYGSANQVHPPQSLCWNQLHRSTQKVGKSVCSQKVMVEVTSSFWVRSNSSAELEALGAKIKNRSSHLLVSFLLCLPLFTSLSEPDSLVFSIIYKKNSILTNSSFFM